MTDKQKELQTLLDGLEYSLKDARLNIVQAERCLVDIRELLDNEPKGEELL